MPRTKANRRAANAAARTGLLDYRSKRRPNGNRADRQRQDAITAIAMHMRACGPRLAYWHVFDELIELDIAFPGLTFRDFIRASVVACAEGSG
jgi:hypothetical protein